MFNKKKIKKHMILLLSMYLLFVSSFCYVHANETDQSEESRFETEIETHLQTESSETESVETESVEAESMDTEIEHHLSVKIIGNGYVNIQDSEGNIICLDETSCKKEELMFLHEDELKIKAEAFNNDYFIYRFYVKTESGDSIKQSITGKGYSHEIKIGLTDDTKIFVVFAKIDEKEIVLDTTETVDNRIGFFSLGGRGQNWGMYNVFTGYTVIPELGSNTDYPYSHIIQKDVNGDGEYEDITYTAYCIEYGIECPSGGYYRETDLSPSQKDYIGYALAYGWQQNGNDYDEEQYKSNQNRTEWAITQGIIWCCTKNIFNTSSGDAAMSKIISMTHDPDHGTAYYQKLKSTILNIKNKPSFDGQSIVLEWNESNKRYEKSLIDTSNMLEYFDYQYNGINFSKDGQMLTIYTTNTYPDFVSVSAARNIYGGEDAVITWDGTNYNQDMVTYKEHRSEIISTINVMTKENNGFLKIKKISSKSEITNGSSNYSLEGSQYVVYSDSSCTNKTGELKTTLSGESNILTLKSGTYYIKETKEPKGYLLDESVHKIVVKSGETTTVSLEEIPVTGELNIKKQSTNPDLFENNENYSDLTATFYIYDQTGKHIKTIYTDVQGNGNCKELALGTYTVKEIKPPKGYKINSEEYPFEITLSETSVTQTIKNEPVLGEIVVTKTIHVNDINYNNGNPMFMFKLVGKNYEGGDRVWYKLVDFTEEFVTNNQNDEGDVSMSVVFEKLYAGEYSVCEMETSRYTIEDIKNIQNGIRDGNRVIFQLKDGDKMEGTAVFVNDNYEQQNYSDSAKAINELKK